MCRGLWRPGKGRKTQRPTHHSHQPTGRHISTLPCSAAPSLSLLSLLWPRPCPCCMFCPARGASLSPLHHTAPKADQRRTSPRQAVCCFTLCGSLPPHAPRTTSCAIHQLCLRTPSSGAANQARATRALRLCIHCHCHRRTATPPHPLLPTHPFSSTATAVPLAASTAAVCQATCTSLPLYSPAHHPTQLLSLLEHVTGLEGIVQLQVRRTPPPLPLSSPQHPLSPHPPMPRSTRQVSVSTDLTYINITGMLIFISPPAALQHLQDNPTPPSSLSSKARSLAPRLLAATRRLSTTTAGLCTPPDSALPRSCVSTAPHPRPIHPQQWHCAAAQPAEPERYSPSTRHAPARSLTPVTLTPPL